MRVQRTFCWQNRAAAALVAALLCLAGCGSGAPAASLPAVQSVVPSATGTPLMVATWSSFEFVSVQDTGQIFTYKVSGTEQAAVGSPYQMPCNDPSGMAVASVAGSTVLAVVCFDTGTLVTLTVHGDGTLSALGAVGGLDAPYPGIALAGTDVLVPLFGVSQGSNGGVARVSIASPADPVITGVAQLASPLPGGYANPGALSVAGGYIYVAAGSESGPLSASSTIQVVDETSMRVDGSPMVVDHSPQQVAVSAGVAYVSVYDASELLAVDVSTPAQPRLLAALPLPGCGPLPVAVLGSTAYVGCYAGGTVDAVDISAPARMEVKATAGGIVAPQSFAFTGNTMIAVGSARGGAVYALAVTGGVVGRVQARRASLF